MESDQARVVESLRLFRVIQRFELDRDEGVKPVESPGVQSSADNQRRRELVSVRGADASL